MHLNIEIKANCTDPELITRFLEENNAVFHGTDFQSDTYFNVNNGRLKLREGNIENALIHYQRENIAGPKTSHVSLYHPAEPSKLKSLLIDAMGIRVVVIKERTIYFIGNVKFHIDKVEGLGSFVEIEAIDIDSTIGKEKLLAQCNFYLEAFGIRSADLLTDSYSDMLYRANH